MMRELSYGGGVTLDGSLSKIHDPLTKKAAKLSTAFAVADTHKFHKTTRSGSRGRLSGFLAKALAIWRALCCWISRILLVRSFPAAMASIVLLFLAASVISLPVAICRGEGGAGDGRKDLFPEILRDEAVSRLNELAKVSDVDSYLERTFLSPASVRAGSVIRNWMEDAGLRTWVDVMGNIHGRVAGMNPDAPALLLGSHLDTVVDAGKFDGALGIITAISALKVLKANHTLGELRRPVEVIAFSDEEGVRFQSTFLGSAVIAGVLPASSLNISDKRGRTLQQVLEEKNTGVSEESLVQMKYKPESVWGYVEIHIEQGPVLEALGLPLGVVKGIAGQTRLKVELQKVGILQGLSSASLEPGVSSATTSLSFETGVTVKGSQGHAGTVPMSMRRDPMAAAAELIVQLESVCKRPEDFLPYDGQCNLSGSLVCTVGEISCWPSASNVIPGQVSFTIDLRAMDDVAREAVLYELSNRMYQICEKRSVSCLVERKHDANGVNCDSELSSQLKTAALSAFRKMAGNVEEVQVPVLMSGAGHDAMAMSHLTKVGMMFVRCRGGISHSPEEHVLDDDVWAGGLAMLSLLQTQMAS